MPALVNSVLENLHQFATHASSFCLEPQMMFDPKHMAKCESSLFCFFMCSESFVQWYTIFSVALVGIRGRYLLFLQLLPFLCIVIHGAAFERAMCLRDHGKVSAAMAADLLTPWP
jgi:hypothetical protein